jgi:hypothetical protein
LKTGLATTILALAVAGALAVPASAATPTERRLSAQIKVVQRQVKVLQGQVRTLRRQMRDVQIVSSLGVAFSACSAAASADALQGTWETIDGLNAHLGRPDQYPAPAPIADPLNSCNLLEVQRQPSAVPPTTNVFAALLNIFR